MNRASAAAILMALGGGSAWAQTGADFVACPSQEEVEQHLGSGGELVPEGCRTVNVTVLESDGRQLCVVDISSEGDTVLGSIADAAVPTQWWVACEDASALLE